MQVDPVIPAHARYMAAWAELGQRVVTRAQLNFGHMATIVALTAAYVSIPELPAPPCSHNVFNVDNHLWPAVLMPLVSWIFVSWYRHNELIIGALSLYMAQFEELDFANGSKLPPYFYRSRKKSEQEQLHKYCIQDYVLEFRSWSDRATMSICAASPVLTVVSVIGGLMEKSDFRFSVSELGSIAVAAWCIFLSTSVILWLRRVSLYREHILDGHYDPETGLFDIRAIH
jgi:hypothetical protein